jgi:hypothetical protein
LVARVRALADRSNHRAWDHDATGWIPGCAELLGQAHRVFDGTPIGTVRHFEHTARSVFGVNGSRTEVLPAEYLALHEAFSELVCQCVHRALKRTSVI